MPTSNEAGKMPLREPLKHEEVAYSLQTAIEHGELQAGERLAGEFALADELGVSRGTIRKALELLANRGYIATENGRGSFVTYEGRDLSEPKGWTESLLNAGVKITTKILRIDFISDPALAIHLGIGTPEFLAIDRLRSLEDSTVISLERSRVRVNEDLRKIIREEGLVEGSISATLRQAGLVVAGGEQWVQALPLSEEDASLMGSVAGTLYLQAMKISQDTSGMAIEQVTSTLDPSKFRFHVSF